MSQTMFDQDAPRTVRWGAVCLALVSLFDFMVSLLTAWSEGGLSLGPWRAVYRPAIGLIAGLTWAWGIAHMLGAFYWTWVAMMVLVAIALAIMLILSALGVGTPVASHTWTVGDGIGLALVLAACVLLLSRSSLRAYRQHGRLSPRKTPGA